MAEHRDRWRAVVTTEMNLGFRKTRGIAGLSEEGALLQADRSAGLSRPYLAFTEAVH